MFPENVMSVNDSDAAGEAISRVLLSTGLYKKIREQAKEGLPNEICGYVSSLSAAFQNGGPISEITIAEVHPLRNVDESPEHYQFDPSEQFEVFKQVNAQGGRLVGSYHSHPETPARMSDEDIRLARDEGMLYGIYSVKEELLEFFTVKKNSNGGKEVHKLSTVIVN